MSFSKNTICRLMTPGPLFLARVQVIRESPVTGRVSIRMTEDRLAYKTGDCIQVMRSELNREKNEPA